MLLYLGPIIFGFLTGLLLGTRINPNPESDIKFTIGSYIIIFIAALIVAWQIGPYPFYNDIAISTGFISGAVGLIVGNLLRIMVKT